MGRLVQVGLIAAVVGALGACGSDATPSKPKPRQSAGAGGAAGRVHSEAGEGGRSSGAGGEDPGGHSSSGGARGGSVGSGATVGQGADTGDAGTGAGGEAGAAGSGSKGPSVAAGCGKPLDRSVPTGFYELSRCLFEGTDASQHDIQSDAIDPERVAILRGRVLDETGVGLGGARVTVLGHDELGWVETRADGYFDLAANGGGPLTLRFERSGRLPSQRRQVTSWRHYSVLPDVVLLRRAEASEPLVLGGGAALASGPRTSDASGARKPRLVFPAGTHATAVLPGGATEDLPSLSVRMTEYTVGERGPRAMPGDLPPSSGYTYAIELSVDEAEALDATRVEFDRPLAFHVDNFIGFPAGTVVPLGFYDRDLDAWLPAESGLVVDVVDDDGDDVTLDVDGDGKADGADALEALGVDADERAAIAQEFDAGDSLWRLRIEHFSAWDANWPYVPPDGSAPPNASADPPDDDEDPTCSVGSIIACENQALGEIFPIAGTPYSLFYQSQRAAGRLDTSALDIRLSGAEPLTNVKRIELTVEVLGQQTKSSFAPAPNLWTTYTWDGRDANGRLVQGRHPVTVRVEYLYDPVYGTTLEFGGAVDFATKYPGRDEIGLGITWRGYVGKVDAASSGLGGLSLGAQHVYDAESQTLYFGTGAKRSGERIGDVIRTAIGTGVNGTDGDGGLAEAARIDGPHGIAIAPDGSIFLSDDPYHCIRKVLPNGLITTYAGAAHLAGSDGDGGPAVDARFNNPMGLALAADGTLFVADASNALVRAIGPDGIVRTVMGGGKTVPVAGTRVPALDVAVKRPHALALGPAGNLIVADEYGNFVLSLDPDGQVSLLVGGGTSTEEDVRGVDSIVKTPLGVVAGSAGEVFFTEYDGHRVRKLDAAGRVTTVAGVGEPGFSGDGGPAALAELYHPHTVALGPSGALYITDEGNGRVRRVSADGVIETVAGGASPNDGLGDGLPPLDARFSQPRVVYAHHDGSLLIADYGANRVRRVTPGLPGVSPEEKALPSADAVELYVFDAAGRHLRTENAITGATLVSFDYDSDGNLAGILDQAGAETRVERASDGRSLTLVSPFGVRTELALGDDGRVSSITEPDGGVRNLLYDAGGLLLELNDPRSAKEKHHFEYDAVGRLTSDTSPSGYTQTLASKLEGSSRVVTRTTSLGRKTTYALTPSKVLSDFGKALTAPGGLVTTTERTALQEVVTTPTGTQTTRTFTPDPRFGLQAAYVSALQLRTGSHHDYVVTQNRVPELDSTGALVRLTETTSFNGDTTTVTHDVAARTRTTVTPLGRTSTASWDELGRIDRQTLGPFETTISTFDVEGRLIALQEGDRATALTYDDSGWLKQITDALGNAGHYAHDGSGRTTSSIDADGNETLFAYDQNGNVTGVTPPDQPEHSQSFGPGDLFERYDAPDVSGDTATELRSYDGDEALEKVTHPDATVTTYAHDAATGRLTSITDAEGKREYDYDAATGQLLAERTPEQSVALGYDGDLEVTVTFDGEVSGLITRKFNDELRIASESIEAGAPLPRLVTYSYDADGLIVQAGGETLTRGIDHPFVTGTSIGTVQDSYGYSAYGEIISYAASAATSLYTVDVERDALGRIEHRIETIGGVTTDERFGYDKAGRLTSVERDGDPLESYTYDGNGNRLTVTTKGGARSATYDAQDRIQSLGTTSYTFDANGALGSRDDSGGTTLYRYDVRGNLRNVALPDGRTITYTVDARGRRLSKQIDGTTVKSLLFRDDLQPAAELDAGGNLTSVFVYGARSNVPDLIIRGSTTYRVISDLLGSPRLVVDTATGATAQRLDYDAWGNVTNDTNPGFQPFGFAGGLYDPDTALVRFGARDYDAESGRWTARDPIRFEGRQANLYSYVDADPINHWDPSGTVSYDCMNDCLSSQGVFGSALGLAACVHPGYLLGGTALIVYGCYTACRHLEGPPVPEPPRSPGSRR